MFHSRPIAGVAAAVVIVSAGLASVATGASAATVKAHTPKCFGKTATLVVTGNNKTVHAPKGRLNKPGSVIVALGKGDKVYGGDGNDKICVGNAHSVTAGKGSDDVQFTTGFIHGNDGNDLLQQVGKGNAQVFGDAGNDKIKLARGNSTAYGGDGNDSLSAGGSGNQKLLGQNGNDNFYSGGATATMDGGAMPDNYTVHGTDAARTIVIPGGADRVNGQYVRVDAPTNGFPDSVLSYAEQPGPVAYATQSSLAAGLDGRSYGQQLVIDHAIAPAGRTIASWSVNWGDGTPLLSGQGTPPGEVGHGYLVDGAHGITVSVTDSAGKTTLHGITVLVAKAPTAIVRSTVAGGTATFTTTAAADPGQSALTGYVLDFGDGSEPLSAAGPPPASITHAYPAAGKYTANLTVLDSHGGAATDPTSVTVANTGATPTALLILTKAVDVGGPANQERGNSSVVVGGAKARVLEVGQRLSVDAVATQGSASDGDVTETIDLGDGLGPQPGDSGQPTYSVPGVKTITVSVTQEQVSSTGAVTTATATSTATVTVTAGSLAARLSVPSGPEGTFTASTAGTSAPPGQAITAYTLTGPDGLDVFGVGAPPAVITQKLPAGAGDYSLTVRDSLGQTDTTYAGGEVTGDHPTVDVPGWQAATAGGGDDPGAFLPDFTATASYGGRLTGGSVNYGDGSGVTDTHGAPDIVSRHGYAKPGNYTVTTSVTDSFKRSASASQVVSVAGKPTVTLAAGANAPANTPVTFTVTASPGANAGVIGYVVDFGDENDSAAALAAEFSGGYTAQVPASFTHSFPTAGEHDVNITIYNDHGGSAMTSVVIPGATT